MPRTKRNTTVAIKILQPDSAGIDIGSKSSFVALPPDRNEPVREFQSFTADYIDLANWLESNGIQTVAMESTGVYWIPLYQLLVSRRIEVYLVNARDVKAVPGRKSDVQDCQWIQYLHSVGLLRASFRPEQDITAIRTITRLRNNIVRGCAQAIHRMQKVLTEMNVLLHNVISDISGTTGLAIIDAILEGERNPVVLAQLRDPRIKASSSEISKSLQGDYYPEHIFALRIHRETYSSLQRQIAQCDEEIFNAVQAYNRSHGAEAASPPAERKNRQKKLRLRNGRDSFLHAEMRKAFGIDLFELPGFATDTVLTVFTEVGPNFHKFRNEAAFTCWLALCPNNEITGGKVKRSKTKQSKSRLAAALRQAACSLANSHSYYGELFRRFRAKFGAPKAVTAMACRLARLLYFLVSTKQEFDETKFSEAAQRSKEYKIRALERKARHLGCQLITA